MNGDMVFVDAITASAVPFPLNLSIFFASRCHRHIGLSFFALSACIIATLCDRIFCPCFNYYENVFFKEYNEFCREVLYLAVDDCLIPSF
jgi:hypothetical protein